MYFARVFLDFRFCASFGIFFQEYLIFAIKQHGSTSANFVGYIVNNNKNIRVLLHCHGNQIWLLEF